jgi:hypothetical protein
MSSWNMPSFRSPLWRGIGWALLAGTLATTGFLAMKSPNHRSLVRPGNLDDYAAGQRGNYGTLTERLGKGRFDLKYARIEGRESDLRLQEVEGRLEEPDASWTLVSPAAHRAQEGLWDLDAPVRIKGTDAAGTEIGHGEARGSGVALRWEKGTWVGLAPLAWETLEGQGRGRWTLPPGWRREADGILNVERGPVVWEAPPGSQLQGMTAQTLQLSPRFEEGTLTSVEASFIDGKVWAQRAEFSKENIRWFAPMRFQRSDGWKGDAEAGVAPRPRPGTPLQSVEFKGFKGWREIEGGQERAESLGARWTPAGLRLEGSVRWEQPVDGERLQLNAPRILLREGPGDDLPVDLPDHWARAEGQAVLKWGNRSLTGPRMEVNRLTRAWRIQAPVLGRSEEGTFSAGEGRGNPSNWTFDGPVVVSLSDGGQLRGQRLAWAGDQWTLVGRPATWNRLGERLAGHRLVRMGEHLVFPEGLSGALATPEGDLTLHSDRGERDAGRLTVEGQVEVQGRGWTLKADRVVVELAPGRIVKQVKARGRVSLEGQLGQGLGESLDLDPTRRQATWAGRVRGTGKVKPW